MLIDKFECPVCNAVFKLAVPQPGAKSSSVPNAPG